MPYSLAKYLIITKNQLKFSKFQCLLPNIAINQLILIFNQKSGNFNQYYPDEWGYPPQHYPAKRKIPTFNLKNPSTTIILIAQLILL